MHLKSIVQIVFSLFVIIIINGCDSKPTITYYDKSLKGKSHPLNCLEYVPKNDSNLDKSLLTLYNFNSSCKYRLQLSYDSNIVCKSQYNVSTKNTSNYPNAYITLEVRDGFKLLYSYYKDLYHKPTKNDLEEAFNHIKDDLL